MHSFGIEDAITNLCLKNVFSSFLLLNSNSFILEYRISFYAFHQKVPTLHQTRISQISHLCAANETSERVEEIMSI